MYRVLKQTGSFYLHCDFHAGQYLKCVCDEIFGYDNFQNEIIWYYSNKFAKTVDRCVRSHDNIYFYTKSQVYTYNPLLISSKSDNIAKYNKIDKNGNRYMEVSGRKRFYHGGKRVISDVWEIYHVNSQSKERIGYATQKPLELVNRIIKTSSNEDNIVADFFCGSGTSLIAAKFLGRKYFGVNINPEAVRLTKERLTSSRLLTAVINLQQKEMF